MEQVARAVLHTACATFHTRSSTLAAMDPLSGLLDRTRARGAFVLCSVLAAPWSIKVEDRAPLTLVAVIRGAAAITTAVGTQAELHDRDIALLRGPEPYIVADPPSTSPQVSIGPDQVCTLIDPAARPMGPLGVRSWGNDPAGETPLLTATSPPPPCCPAPPPPPPRSAGRCWPPCPTCWSCGPPGGPTHSWNTWYTRLTGTPPA